MEREYGGRCRTSIQLFMIGAELPQVYTPSAEFSGVRTVRGDVTDSRFTTWCLGLKLVGDDRCITNNCVTIIDGID